MAPNTSSDDFATGSFKPHGRLELVTDGDIVVYTAVGPFNLEFVQTLSKLRAARQSQRPQAKRIAAVHVFEKSMLMAPEALAALAETVHHLSTDPDPPIALAYVVSQDVEGRNIMLPIIRKMYSDVCFPWQSFEDMDSATAWIRSHLVRRNSE